VTITERELEGVWSVRVRFNDCDDALKELVTDKDGIDTVAVGVDVKLTRVVGYTEAEVVTEEDPSVVIEGEPRDFDCVTDTVAESASLLLGEKLAVSTPRSDSA
jgi:hypothetical protein